MCLNKCEAIIGMSFCFVLGLGACFVAALVPTLTLTVFDPFDLCCLLDVCRSKGANDPVILWMTGGGVLGGGGWEWEVCRWASRQA